MCMVCAKHTIGSDILLDTPDGILGDVGHVESRSVHLEMLLVLVQDRCKDWPNIPEAQISVRTHPMVLLGDEAQLEAHFGPFGDSARLARNIP